MSASYTTFFIQVLEQLITGDQKVVFQWDQEQRLGKFVLAKRGGWLDEAGVFFDHWLFATKKKPY